MRKIFVLVYPGCQGLDVVGPVDTFSMTNEICADRGVLKPPYEIVMVSVHPGDISLHGGVLQLRGVLSSDEIPLNDITSSDTLLITGGIAALSAGEDPKTNRFVQQAFERAGRVASVCTGAFLLAHSGKLDGKEITTHWRAAQALAADFPNIKVKPDSMVHKDGKVWSSGGITAGVDLALALVEEDLGSEVARAVARMMVMFLARPGSQRQFGTPESETELVSVASDQKMQEIINHIRTNPAADLSREALAAKFNMTVRTLSRRVRAFTGLSVADFVTSARVTHARLRLEDTDETFGEVAKRTGFGTVDAMRRGFRKHVGVGPSDYRARFRSAFEPSD